MTCVGKILLLSFFLFTVTTKIAGKKSRQCYRAASYEHIPAGYDDEIDPDDAYLNVRKNIIAFAIAAQAAKDEKADIIVFPEDGIITPNKMKGINSTYRDGVSLLAEDIPDPQSLDQPIVPCDNADFDFSPILQNLSCIAASNEIYVVACMVDVKNCSQSNKNTCREDGLSLYNTQVAFDRNGSLIARYHKYHLFGEYYHDVPETQELVYFDADFGARVGMYICFDRMFHDPLVTLVQKFNVTTMTLSTWWFDEYPFLVSHQIDQFQSMKLGVNIISANAKHLATGTTGSGVFSPSYVGVNVHDIGRHRRSSRPTLSIANLPVDPREGKCDPDPWSIGISQFKVKPGQVYQPYLTNFSAFQTSKLTEKSSDNVTLCQDNFCCSLKYELKENEAEKNTDDSSYYFAVANRTRGGYYLSQYQWVEQVCFIVKYNSVNKSYSMTHGNKFKRLQIKGDNFVGDYVYATAISNEWKLIPSGNIIRTTNEMSLQSSKPILMAGLYGRAYERDPEYIQSTYGESDEI